MNVILASASPRRKQLLAQIIKEFTVCPAQGEERTDCSLPPEQIVVELAKQKAKEVYRKNPKSAVLGADTIVYFEGKVLGKPSDAEDAKRTLRSLSGKTHSVYTGWCLMAPNAERSGAVRSDVTFCKLDEGFISEYVSSGSPLDKAGSYGIQDDERIVKTYQGSYTNIIGLPVEEIREQLRKIGVQTND